MRVAVDATPLLGARTGVGEVVAGLIGAFAARDDVEPVAYAVTWYGRATLEAALPPRVRAATRPIPARLAWMLWSRAHEPRVERWTGPVDVVHALNFVAPPARAPVVVMIHDLTFLRYPELCSGDTLRYPAAVQRALARGAHVHVPSDFVGGEVAERFELAADRITRVYSGIGDVRGGNATAGRQLARTEHYVLALGTIEPRKNLPTLVQAFDALASDDAEVRLVVAGPDGWGADALAATVARARHRDRICRLGWVDAPARRDLLAGASVFAYPSLYEGFGFPPLEAMAAGVPVVAARAGALPEVLGDAAELVEPLDTDALTAALHRALTDDARRAELVGKGTTRAARYTWTGAADQLVHLYRRLT